MGKHWHLLTNRHVLNRQVRSTPELMFRRASSLRDRLTSSHYRTFPSPVIGPCGTCQCGQCPHCPWVLEGNKYRLPNGKMLAPRTSSHCGTKGVIYLMFCKCNAFYVGKTIHEFRQRIGDHLYYSGNGKLTTVGLPIGLYHKFDLMAVRFFVLEVDHPSPRGAIGITPPPLVYPSPSPLTLDWCN